MATIPKHSVTSALIASINPDRCETRSEAALRERTWRLFDSHADVSRMAPLAMVLRGLASYADRPPYGEHRGGSPLGADGVIGNAWLIALGAVVEMLNGETHGMDPGTLDGAARSMARAAGFSENEADALDPTIDDEPHPVPSNRCAADLLRWHENRDPGTGFSGDTLEELRRVARGSTPRVRTAADVLDALDALDSPSASNA